METVLNGRDREKIHTHWEFSDGKTKIISEDRQILEHGLLVQLRCLYQGHNEGSLCGLQNLTTATADD